MGLFDALRISATGMSAERTRMDVVANNLANAQALNRQVGVGVGGRVTADGRGVRVAEVAEDPTPNRQIYDPGHPDANGEGYISLPNVNPVTEMVDLIASSRSYEANVTAAQTAKQMFTKTMDLLR
jgi:flagellar basal-body rod protein FlgC